MTSKEVMLAAFSEMHSIAATTISLCISEGDAKKTITNSINNLHQTFLKAYKETK